MSYIRATRELKDNNLFYAGDSTRGVPPRSE